MPSDYCDLGRLARSAQGALKLHFIFKRRIASMAYGDRKSERVDFERGIQVYMMGIDGTWRRNCLMVDVSQTGARLCVEGTLQGLDLREFFLLLSSTGLAYRRCRMIRLDGDQIGVEFLKPAKAANKKRSKQRSDETV
jgi:hypothetical protein